MTGAETTKSARELARLLDANGMFAESERSEPAGEYGELLVLASALRSAPRVTPRQEFRDGLRARLLAEAATLAAPAAVSANGHRESTARAMAVQADGGIQATTATLLREAPGLARLDGEAVLAAIPGADPLADALQLTREVARRQVGERAERASRRIGSRFTHWKRSTSLALASALGAFSVAGTGMALAASRSLPGEAFYGLKQASESVQLRTAASDTAESGELHLQFAERRLEELVEGAGSMAPQTLVEVLGAMDQHTVAGTNDLLAAYDVSADQATLHEISDFSGRQQEALRRALPQLPSEVTPFAARSLSIVRQVQAHTGIVPVDCPSCVVPPPLVVPHRQVDMTRGVAPSLPALGDDVTQIVPAIPDVTQPLPLDLTNPVEVPSVGTGTLGGSSPAPPQVSPTSSPQPSPLDVGKTLTDTVGGLLGSTPTPKPSPTTSSLVNLDPLGTVGRLLGQ